MRVRDIAIVVMSLTVAGASDTFADMAASEKGGFRHAEVPSWPETTLDLAPVEAEVWKAASTRCATPLSGASLDMGPASGFMEKMAGKAAGAAVGQLIGMLGGGGGGSKRSARPKTVKDPIKKKFKSKYEDEASKTLIRLGGQAFSDGLLLSPKIEKAKGKGTFHAIYLEQPDCRRYWPDNEMAYDLWGEWSLSVSVTKTTRQYKNGELVNESVSKSGWSRSGTFDFSDGFSLVGADGLSDHWKLLVTPDEAYLNQLKNQIGQPLWQQMGFGEPTKGLRGMGAAFKVTPSALQPGTIAVVHVTRVEGGRYRTVGFPFSMDFGEEGKVAFEQLKVPKLFTASAK
jgi:hypothetical protein